MRLVRIREAKPLDNCRVRLTLTDGRVVERDLGPLLAGPVFAGIRNEEARFREMRVEGCTLVWPDGNCEHYLVRQSRPERSSKRSQSGATGSKAESSASAMPMAPSMNWSAGSQSIGLEEPSRDAAESPPAPSPGRRISRAV